MGQPAQWFVQEATWHIGGGPASLGGTAHDPALLHAPMAVQSAQCIPPTPQVATDWPPTQLPLVSQQPPHDAVPHAYPSGIIALSLASPASSMLPESSSRTAASESTAASPPSLVGPICSFTAPPQPSPSLAGATPISPASGSLTLSIASSPGTEEEVEASASPLS